MRRKVIPLQALAVGENESAPSHGRRGATIRCFLSRMARRDMPPDVKSTAAPAEDFAGMEGPSADSSQRDRPRPRTRHDLLALAVMVVITCVSIAWGLTTLDCPTGKDRWGACNPQDSAFRKETVGFIQRLLMYR